MLGKAISLAATKFENIVDKSGKPYILHCLYVMNNVINQSEDVQVAAVLHDIIEDTNVTIRDLVSIGFSPKSIFLIDVLTHNKKLTYNEYIGQISNHPEAILIKLADLEHNSSILRLKGITDKDLKRIAKYHKAYYFLKSIK